MDLDYDALRMLEAVVRSGSFEAASKSLKVTQSAVSQRIKQLEASIGSILVVRGRPCLPTEDGLLLCQHFEHVMLMEYELSQQMGDADGSSEIRPATIRVSVNSDSLATWFSDVIGRATRELNVLLEVVPDDQEFTEDRLRKGDALAVVTSHNEPIAGATMTMLGEMKYYAVASKSYHEQYFKPNGVTLDNLSRAVTVKFDRKDTLPEQWMQEVFRESVDPPSHYVPSYEGLLRSCRNGVGWIMMPELTIAPLLATGELISMAPEHAVTMPLCWQARSQSSEILLKLTSIVREVAATHLYFAES